MSRRGRINRQVVIDETIHLFQKHGYHNTTMDDIAKACNIQKSSLYHHIPSRKALAKLVIEHLMHSFKRRCHKVAYETDSNDLDRMKKLRDIMHKFFTERQGGRLLSSLAIELGHSFQEINELFKQHFTNWIDAITHVLSDRYDESKARILAEDTVSRIQGAYILEQSYDKKYELFNRAINSLCQLVESED